jgi:hypothetical protein
MKILRIRITGVVNPDPIRTETLRLVLTKYCVHFMQFKLSLEQKIILAASVGDPELDQDSHVFVPSRSGSGGSINVRGGMDPDPVPDLDPSPFS